jgi:plasmid stabilization system protein ParE
MDFKVFLSEVALNDLVRIIAYIAPLTPLAAEQLGNHLLDAALSLHTSSELGRMVPEFRQPDLREIIFRSYRIIFRMNHTDQSLEIVRFGYGAGVSSHSWNRLISTIGCSAYPDITTHLVRIS